MKRKTKKLSRKSSQLLPLTPVSQTTPIIQMPSPILSLSAQLTPSSLPSSNEDISLSFQDMFDLHYCFMIRSRKDLTQLFHRLKNIQKYNSDFKKFQFKTAITRNASCISSTTTNPPSLPNDLLTMNNSNNPYNLLNHEIHTAVAQASIINNTTGSLSAIDGSLDIQQLAWFLAIEQKESSEDYIKLARDLIQVSGFFLDLVWLFIFGDFFILSAISSAT